MEGSHERSALVASYDARVAELEESNAALVSALSLPFDASQGGDVNVSWLVIVNAGPFLRRNQLTALLAPSCPPPLAVHKRTGHRHTCAYRASARSPFTIAPARTRAR